MSLNTCGLCARSFPFPVYRLFRFFFITFLFNRKNTGVAAFSENIYYAIIQCLFAISCVYSMRFIHDRSFCGLVSMLRISLTVSSFSRFPIMLLFLSLFFKLASLLFHAFFFFFFSLTFIHTLFLALIIARLHRSTLLLDYRIPKLHSLSLSLSLSPCRIKARTGGKVGLTV